MGTDNKKECCKKTWDLAVKYKEEDAYAVQMKWQRSTVHDVCGLLMRVDGEKYEPVCWMIRNYYKLEQPEIHTPPQSDEQQEQCNSCGDLNGENIGTIFSSCCGDCESSYPNGYPVGQCTFCLGTGIVKNKEGNNIDVIKRMAPKGYFCR